MYKTEGRIRDVFEYNMNEEIKKISLLIQDFNYVSMDTEFPGIVFPLNQNSTYNAKNLDIKEKNIFKADESYYKSIKHNVDNLKLIQIGITLSNEFGEFPEEISTWQFNFKFDLDRDTHLLESINLLEMAGINFKLFNEKGISMESFGEILTTSGLVLNDNIKWVTFHGSYDFAYMLKVLTNQGLPDDEEQFNVLMGIYFPCYYDVRQMIRNTWLKGSLSRISNDLDIRRIGNSHQAGSDSLITSKVFFKICNNLTDQIDLMNDMNKLYGFQYKILEENEFNGYNYNQIPNYIPINNEKLKSGNMNNIHVYQNLSNSFTNYNNNGGLNMNHMMFNNYNMTNFNHMYPQPSYEYNGYYNNFYSNNVNSFKNGIGNKDAKFISQS